EITRRQRQRAHEEFREHAAGIITKLLRKKNDVVGPDAEPIIDRIQNWFRYRTGDEVGALLEEIVGTGKARDAAYDILQRAGRIDPSLDRSLVLAGIDADFSEQVKEACEQLAPYVHHESRFNYENVPAFTIDDEDTREVDDALTVQHSGSEIIVGI